MTKANVDGKTAKRKKTQLEKKLQKATAEKEETEAVVEQLKASFADIETKALEVMEEQRKATILLEEKEGGMQEIKVQLCLCEPGKALGEERRWGEDVESILKEGAHTLTRTHPLTHSLTHSLLSRTRTQEKYESIQQRVQELKTSLVDDEHELEEVQRSLKDNKAKARHWRSKLKGLALHA